MCATIIHNCALEYIIRKSSLSITEFPNIHSYLINDKSKDPDNTLPVSGYLFFSAYIIGHFSCPINNMPFNIEILFFSASTQL